MDSNKCENHGLKRLYFKKDDKCYYLCTICLFQDKEQLSFYYENFDSFGNIEDSEYIGKLKDYEGFANINKAFKEALESVNIGSEFEDTVYVNQQRAIDEMKEGLLTAYLSTTEKFEKTVEELTVKTDKLDLSLKSAKDELQNIQASLEEQIQILESEEKINDIFNKIFIRFDTRNRFLNLTKYTDPELKINFRRGIGSLLFANARSPVLIAANRGGSYWADFSEEQFEGAFFARLKVNNIVRKSDWSLNIGIARAASTNTNSYYQEGAFFMCSGKITVQFQGNVGRNFLRQWNSGDEIIIRRDELNNVYFGFEEDKMELAFTNISGRYKICVGFSASMNGDNIEILEVDNQV